MWDLSHTDIELEALAKANNPDEYVLVCGIYPTWYLKWKKGRLKPAIQLGVIWYVGFIPLSF